MSRIWPSFDGALPVFLSDRAPPTRLEREREYISLLRSRILAPLFIDLRARVAGATSAAEVDRAVEEATAAAEARGVPVESVRAQLNRLSAYHRARVIQTMISALGVDVGPMLTEPAVNAFMSDVVSRNVDLIKTIPPRFHDSMKDRLSAELRDQPFDRQRLTKLLAREYGSTGYNLRRLARDQTTKTIGGLTEIRQRQLGIQGYRWSSSADERVRPTHAANNGRMFRWDSPPAATGHPGTDIQCRCVAIPAVLKADRARLGAKPAPARRRRQPEPTVFPAKGSRRKAMPAREEKRLDKDAAFYLQNEIPAAQRDAISAYTRGADRLNVPLRSGRKVPASIQRDADRIRKVIDGAPNPPPPALVWRGISHRIGNPKVGTTMQLDGFTSTSVDPAVGASFARGTERTIFEIRPKAGVYIKPISSGAFKHEKEYLMRHGRKYRVAGVEEAKVGKSPRKYRIIQLEEIDD